MLALTMVARSTFELRRSADKMPAGTPIMTAKIMALTPSSTVVGKRSRIEEGGEIPAGKEIAQSAFRRGAGLNAFPEGEML